MILNKLFLTFLNEAHEKEYQIQTERHLRRINYVMGIVFLSFSITVIAQICVTLKDSKILLFSIIPFAIELVALFANRHNPQKAKAIMFCALISHIAISSSQFYFEFTQTLQKEQNFIFGSILGLMTGIVINGLQNWYLKELAFMFDIWTLLYQPYQRLPWEDLRFFLPMLAILLLFSSLYSYDTEAQSKIQFYQQLVSKSSIQDLKNLLQNNIPQSIFVVSSSPKTTPAKTAAPPNPNSLPKNPIELDYISEQLEDELLVVNFQNQFFTDYQKRFKYPLDINAFLKQIFTPKAIDETNIRFENCYTAQKQTMFDVILQEIRAVAAFRQANASNPQVNSRRLTMAAEKGFSLDEFKQFLNCQWVLDSVVNSSFNRDSSKPNTKIKSTPLRLRRSNYKNLYGSDQIRRAFSTVVPKSIHHSNANTPQHAAPTEQTPCNYALNQTSRKRSSSTQQQMYKSPKHQFTQSPYFQNSINTFSQAMHPQSQFHNPIDPILESNSESGFLQSQIYPNEDGAKSNSSTMQKDDHHLCKNPTPPLIQAPSISLIPCSQNVVDSQIAHSIEKNSVFFSQKQLPPQSYLQQPQPNQAQQQQSSSLIDKKNSSLTSMMQQANSANQLNSASASVSGNNMKRKKKRETLHLDIQLVKCQWEENDAVMVIMNDISEKMMNLRLREGEKYKDQMLATVTHNLKTPMNSMVSVIDRLLKKDKRNKDLRILNSNTNMLLSMIMDILDYQSIKRKSFKLQLEPFDVIDLLWSIKRIYEILAEIKGLEIIIVNKIADPELQFIIQDGDRIKQILHNLVGNAIKFTKTGSVTITASTCSWGNDQRDKSYNNSVISIEVKDTGPGIEETLKANLFKTLAVHDFNYKKPGIGLGLSICKMLVKLLGPRRSIQVDSAPGKGSTFTFFIFRNLLTSPKQYSTEVRELNTNQEIQNKVIAQPRGEQGQQNVELFDPISVKEESNQQGKEKTIKLLEEVQVLSRKEGVSQPSNEKSLLLQSDIFSPLPKEEMLTQRTINLKELYQQKKTSSKNFQGGSMVSLFVDLNTPLPESVQIKQQVQYFSSLAQFTPRTSHQFIIQGAGTMSSLDQPNLRSSLRPESERFPELHHGLSWRDLNHPLHALHSQSNISSSRVLYSPIQKDLQPHRSSFLRDHYDKTGEITDAYLSERDFKRNYGTDIPNFTQANMNQTNIIAQLPKASNFNADTRHSSLFFKNSISSTPSNSPDQNQLLSQINISLDKQSLVHQHTTCLAGTDSPKIIPSQRYNVVNLENIQEDEQDETKPPLKTNELPISEVFSRDASGDFSSNSQSSESSQTSNDDEVQPQNDQNIGQESEEETIQLDALFQTKTQALIVDDNPFNIFVLRNFLQNCKNIELSQASDGKEAYEMYQIARHDLIFMDLNMPVMDGYESIRLIRTFEKSEKLRESVIFAVTAQDTIRDIQQSIDSGANGHIAKPVKLSSFYSFLYQYFKHQK